MVAKILLILGLALVANVTHAFAYVLLAGWALFGPRRAIESLTLSWLLNVLNPAVFSISEQASVLRWLPLGSAFVCVAVYTIVRGFRVSRPWLWIACFGVLAGGVSIYASYAPIISIFKLVSFLMGATAVILGLHQTRHFARYWQRWFITLFVVVLFLGLPLIGHELGYVRNQRGFQGLTQHPQTYTAFIAPFLAWISALILTRQLKGTLWFVVFGIALVSLVATEGRTGALAAGLGFSIAVVWKWFQNHEVRYDVIRWVPLVVLLLVVAGSAGVVSDTDIRSKVVGFVMKRGDVQEVDLEEGAASRIRMIEASLSNFRENPYAGIGFGVGSFPGSFETERDPYLGLPVGASIEKGFTITAVLEEVGIIGFVGFLLVVGSLLRLPFGATVSVPPAVLAAAAFMVNAGEAVFFAFGGNGLLIWLLIGVSYVIAQREARIGSH